MDGGIAIGILALVAVWVYTNGKVQAAAIASNPLSPSGIAAGGAAAAGLGSLIGNIGSLFKGGNSYNSGGSTVTGSNNSGGPLGGQDWSTYNTPQLDGPNPSGSIGALDFGLSNPPVVTIPDGGPDGSDTTYI